MYIKKGVPLNIEHFLLRANDSGDFNSDKISNNEFLELLKIKIKAVDMRRVKADISRFIPDPDVLNIWSREYFLDLIKNLKFV